MSGNKQAIDELMKVLEKLQIKRDRLKEQLTEAEKECDAISAALRVLGHTSIDVDLSGMKQMEALVAIAKANNDELSVKAARRQMSRYGLFKNSDNASSIIHTAITRSGKFERVRSGVYRLLPETETMKLELTKEDLEGLEVPLPLASH
jgi:hypothetical protein